MRRNQKNFGISNQVRQSFGPDMDVQSNVQEQSSNAFDMQQMLADSGLQVHPKQQQDLMKNSKLQKMLHEQSNPDPQLQQILQRASDTQKGIQNTIQNINTAPAYADQVSERELDMELQRKIEKIMMGRGDHKQQEQPTPYQTVQSTSSTQKKIDNEFQQILDDQFASKIAQEISKKNVVPYDDQKSRQSTGRTSTKKQANSNLRMATFSSNQKNIQTTPKLAARKMMEKRVDRTIDFTPPYFGGSDNRSNTFIEDDVPIQRVNKTFTQKKQPQRNQLDRQPVLVTRTPITALKPTYKKSGTISQNSSVGRLSVQPRTRQQKFQRMRDDKRASVAHKISPIEKLNESQKLQKRIEEQANELTERMKQMSVYDLYTMNNQNRDNILIDTLIKKQLLERGSLQPTQSPGAAPQAMPTPLVGPSVNEMGNAQMFQKAKNSIIVETVDEHLQSLSMTPSPQFAQGKKNLQKALHRGSLDSLQANHQSDNMRISVNLSPQITERQQQQNLKRENRLSPRNTYNSPRGTNRVSSVEEPQCLKVRQEFQTPGRKDHIPIDSYRSNELISSSKPMNRNSDPTQKLQGQEYAEKRFNTAHRSRRKKGSLHSDQYFGSVKRRYNGGSSLGVLSGQKASSGSKKGLAVSKSFVQKKLTSPVQSKLDGTPSKRLEEIRQGFAEYKNSFRAQTAPDPPVEEKPAAEAHNQLWQKYTEQKSQNDYSNPFKNLFYNHSNTMNQEDRKRALQQKYAESPDKAPEKGSRERRDRSQRSQRSNKQMPKNVETNLFEAMVNKRLNKEEGGELIISSFEEKDNLQEPYNYVDERFKPFTHQKLVNNRPLETPDFTMDIRKEEQRVKSKSPASYHNSKLSKSGEFKGASNLVINVNSKSTGRPKSSNIARSGGLQQNRIKYTRVKELTPYSDLSQKSTGKAMDLTQPILKQKSTTTAGTTKKSYRVPLAKSSYINSKKPTQLVSELLTPTSPMSPESGQKLTDTTDFEIKNFRLQAQDTMQLINLISLNEIDSVKKPQRYMYFICKLFKMMFDLVTNSNNFMTNQIRKQKKDDGVASDISVDKSDIPFMDPTLFQKVKDKYFVTFDNEVKNLKQMLKFEKEIVEKEIQTEWNLVLKPFLLQNSLQFQKNVQALSKNLKKLIEANLKEKANLQLLRQSAETLREILKNNQSLTNQCMKNNGNIYGKFYDAITLCSQYTVKKCTKEIEKFKEDGQESEKQVAQFSDGELERHQYDKDNKASLLSTIQLVQVLKQSNKEYEEQRSQPYVDKIDLAEVADKAQTQQEEPPQRSYRSIQHIIAQRSSSQEAKDSLQDQIQEEISKMKIKRDLSREQFEAETKIYSRMDPSEMIRNNMNHQQIFEYSPPQNQPQPQTRAEFKINLVPVDKDSECEISLLSDRDKAPQQLLQPYEQIPTPSQQSSYREAGGRRSRQSRRSGNSNSKSATRRRIQTPNQYQMMKSPSLVEMDCKSRPVTPKEWENQPLIKAKIPRVIEDVNDSVKTQDNAMMKLQKMEAQTEETQMNANNVLSDDRNEEDVVDSEGNDNQNDIVDIVFDNSRASYQNEGKIGQKVNFEVKKMVDQKDFIEEEVPLPLQAVPTPMEVDAKNLQLELIDQLNQEMLAINDSNCENAYENFKKMKDNMPKISKAFQREYGLYNPDHGIIPYYFDPEYTDPNEPEDFFLSLQKIKQPKIKNLEEAKSPLQQYITKKTPKMMPSSQYNNAAYNSTKSSAKKSAKKRLPPNMDDSGHLLRSPVQNQRVNSRNVDQKIGF